MVEPEPLPPLPAGASSEQRAAQYAAVLERLALLLEGEEDWVAAMATVACELHSALDYSSWTGFYRVLPAPASAAGAAAAGPGSSGAPQQQQTQQAPPPPPPPQQQLVVGPYQGTLGCLRIPFSKGVCGAAARTRQAQLVPDVHACAFHIACASSTRSEVVVPVLAPSGEVLAVLDLDSDLPAAFTQEDARWLERLCGWLGARPWATGL